MSIDVIGVGFERTETLLIKMALEQLSYKKCYHMHDLFSNLTHAETWNRIAHRKTPDAAFPRSSSKEEFLNAMNKP